MSLKGGPELKARLKAVRAAFKPIGRTWADRTAAYARTMVPYRTGRLRGSIQPKSATTRKASVVAHYSAFFVDKGPKAHTIRAKNKPRLIFSVGGRTIFAKAVNHRGYRGRPFRARAAQQALRGSPSMGDTLIGEWNRSG